MSSPPDPSEFAVAVAVGYAHVLDRVLGFLERASHVSPAVALSLALPVLAAYLVVATLAFAVRVAADGYAHVVACNSGAGDDAFLAAREAALAPAAAFGWLAGAALKFAAHLVLLGAALLRFAPALEVASLGLAKAS